MTSQLTHEPVRTPLAQPGPATGLVACAVATALAWGIHLAVPLISPLLAAIVLGTVVANVGPFTTSAARTRLAPGLQFASRRLLRIGVALLGLQLALGEVLALGPWVIATIIAIVAASLAGSLWFGARLGVPVAQRLLIACGTSICGAAAVAAVDGVINADEEDVAAAIGTVVVFGTVLLGAIPLAVAGLDLLGLDLSGRAGGIWAGASIHEVAQVVAAGGMLGSGALAVAVVVKLGRVLMLAPVVTAISLQRRRSGDAGTRPPLVPMFVLGFAACVAVRTAGVLPDAALAVAQFVQVTLLSAAMFALGAGVRIDALRRLGSRPLILGAAGTVWISALGLGAALAFG